MMLRAFEPRLMRGNAFIDDWPATFRTGALTVRGGYPYNVCFLFATGGSMYAVIRSGGKQYRVAPGETVKVETLEGKVGDEVVFGEVLAVSTDDKKLVAGKSAAAAKATGKIVKQGRHPKLIVLKYKTGGQYKIQRGHRQNYTAVQVSDISL
jgi:large subunit ribosomal protein L21